MAQTCVESTFHCEEWLFISVHALPEEIVFQKVDLLADLHDKDVSGRLLNVVCISTSNQHHFALC
jgi:hypothetical protein